MIRNSNHIPVLLHEVMRVLNPIPGEFFVDGTAGGGGHATEILKRVSPRGTLIGIDVDQNAVASLKEKFAVAPNIKLIHASYDEIPEILKRERLQKIDGLLLDLGFSSMHVDDAERGFSFKYDGPLDMRYDASTGISAAEIVNSLPERRIAEILRVFGEERFADQIAHGIVVERKRKRITRTLELADIVRRAVFVRGRTDPATRTFQALRIFVNSEFEHLERLLGAIPEITKSGGRVAIISFHSLEDRIVKNAFRDLAKAGKAEFITKKPIVPSLAERRENPRSRSAKLRAIKII
ncbi:MAG: 16S rRNA (cytosine(1402)-N(4))-methyltransferase RsmH [Candidatus Jorgensenbacteria bacterium]|nr:16S rRNA (cytosine(1402)-N(4))-methyltransferase RsmH [Candidatus Jorgensenbacteria bacterium]